MANRVEFNAKTRADEEPPGFAEAWAAYPKRPGASKADARKAYSARLAQGTNPAQILAGVIAYAAYCKALCTEPQYIKQPATFFGPGEHYLSDWTPPKKALSSPNFAQRFAESFGSAARMDAIDV
ncbi:MAG: hypothetical protein ACRDAM_01905 [Casimicrobium sp.]